MLILRFRVNTLQKRGQINVYLRQRTTYPVYCQKDIMTNYKTVSQTLRLLYITST